MPPTRELGQATALLGSRGDAWDRSPPGASQPGADDLVGRVLDGKYRIEEAVGHGGMATIYRARHLALRRDVAIKVLQERTRSAEQMGARFEREAYSASRLNHPNCLQVTDFGVTDQGVRYMVMELLEGCDLSQHISGAISPERATAYMVQILRGLQHAHENGVIHRDIKPQNIFVTRDHQNRETLKIVDFGLAKILEGEDKDSTMTQVGMVFGTPMYMSPEQAVGMTDIDPRSDLYSAGVVYYWMLAGHAPFEGDDVVSLLRKHVAAPVPPIETRLPRRVRAVLDTLLEKHRDDRYDSAMQVLATLAPRPGNDKVTKKGRRRKTAPGVDDRLATALERGIEDPRFVGVDGNPYDPAPNISGPEAFTQLGMDIRSSRQIELSQVAPVVVHTPSQLPSLTLRTFGPYAVLSVLTFAWRSSSFLRESILGVLEPLGVGAQALAIAAFAVASVLTVAIWWRGD